MKKNNIFKRILAVGIAAMLIVPFGMMWTEGKSVAIASNNLVTNGDFENDNIMDVNGWTPGVPTIKTETANHMANSDFSATDLNWSLVTAGTGSVALDHGEMKLDRSVKYNGRITVQPGQTYTISYKARGEASLNTTRVLLRVIERQSNGSGIGNPYTYEMANRKPPVGGQVATKDHTVQASNAAYIEVQLIVNTPDAYVWIDDFTITSEETVKVELNHIENSDFSSTDLNWSLVTAGTGSVVLDNGEMKLDRSVKYNNKVLVAPGQTYTISYKARGEASLNTTRVFLRIIERKSDGSGIGNPYTYEMANRKPPVGGQVATKDHTVQASNAAYIDVQLIVNTPDAYVWIDNFTLKSTEPVYGDGIVMNDSDYEMRLSNNSQATYTGVTLTADTYYDYSYEVAKDATLTKAGLKIGNEIKTDLTGTFKYATGLSIGFATEGSGIAYFDNLVITAHAHTGGTATCIKQAVCTGCGEEYGPKANHQWNETYEKDETGHWNTCKTTGCQEKGNFAEHSDTNNNDLCEVCSYNVHVHHFSTQWSKDATQHWQQCDVNNCEEKQALGEHTGGTATCTEKAKCTVCAAEYGSVLEHTYDKEVVNETTLKSEATTTAKAVYYKSCECGAISTTETFEYGDVLQDTTTENEPGDTIPEDTTPEDESEDEDIQDAPEDSTSQDVDDATPQTGDGIVGAWFILVIVSVGAISIVLNKKRRMK